MSILFNHRSLQKPAIFAGCLEVPQKDGSLERIWKAALELWRVTKSSPNSDTQRNETTSNVNAKKPYGFSHGLQSGATGIPSIPGFFAKVASCETTPVDRDRSFQNQSHSPAGLRETTPIFVIPGTGSKFTLPPIGWFALVLWAIGGTFPICLQKVLGFKSPSHKPNQLRATRKTS